MGIKVLDPDFKEEDKDTFKDKFMGQTLDGSIEAGKVDTLEKFTGDPQDPNTELRRLNPKDRLIERAKKDFGTTLDFREAGYIFEDGTMLDLSGKTRGGMGRDRVEDHREISRSIETGDKGISGGDAMDFFERQAGAIRYTMSSANTGRPSVSIFLNTFQTPTEVQWIRMRNAITVCKRLATIEACDLAYDVFFNNGDKCKTGFLKNTNLRDIQLVQDNLEICKKEDR